MSLGTLLNLAILECPVVSFIAELVSELLRAAIFVLIKASPAARLSGHLGPLEARLLPGLFACAHCAGSAICSRARLCVGCDFTPQSLWLTKWWSRVPARAVRVVI